MALTHYIFILNSLPTLNYLRNKTHSCLCVLYIADNHEKWLWFYTASFMGFESYWLMCYLHICFIFQRYTKQSLMRNSMKWNDAHVPSATSVRNLIQIKIIIIIKKKKSTKSKTLLHCQQLTKTAVFYFSSVLEADLGYFSVLLLNN